MFFVTTRGWFIMFFGLICCLLSIYFLETQARREHRIITNSCADTKLLHAFSHLEVDEVKDALTLGANIHLPDYMVLINAICAACCEYNDTQIHYRLSCALMILEELFKAGFSPDHDVVLSGPYFGGKLSLRETIANFTKIVLDQDEAYEQPLAPQKKAILRQFIRNINLLIKKYAGNNTPS